MLQKLIMKISKLSCVLLIISFILGCAINKPLQGPVTKSQSEQGYHYLYEVPVKK